MLNEKKIIKSGDLHCPLLDKKCIQEKCMFWAEFNRADETTFQSCAISFLPVLISQQISETISNQAAIETFRNIVAKGADQFMRMVEARERSRVTDGS